MSVRLENGTSDFKTLIFDNPKSITSFGRYGDATIYNSGTTKDMYENFIKNKYYEFHLKASSATNNIEDIGESLAEYSKLFLKDACEFLNIKFTIN